MEQYRRRAPIDVYWDLMKDDKPDEARAVLDAHPNDAACLLELFFSLHSHEYMVKAAHLGNPVAMALLGSYPSNEDLLQKAAQSTSAYARIIVAEYYEGHGENNYLARLNLYKEAIQELETPRVLVSAVEWALLLPRELREMADARLVIRELCRRASDLGVPRGITLWAGELDQDEVTPENNAEIIRLFARPAVRDSPGAIRWLSEAYATRDFMRNHGKAASLMLTLPSVFTREKLGMLAGRLPVVHEGANYDRKDRYGEMCMWGRALALGSVGLPPIPLEFPGPQNNTNVHHVIEEWLGSETSVQGKVMHSNWDFITQLLMPRLTGQQVARTLGRMAHCYREWIAYMRASLMEFLLACRHTTPPLSRDVAKMIALEAWKTRDEDIAIWAPGMEVARHRASRAERTDRVNKKLRLL